MDGPLVDLVAHGIMLVCTCLELFVSNDRDSSRFKQASHFYPGFYFRPNLSRSNIIKIITASVKIGLLAICGMSTSLEQSENF